MSDIEPIKPGKVIKYSETFISIQNWFYDTTGKVVLSESNKKIFERWSFADSQIRMEYVDEVQVPKLLMLKFPGLSRSTAYEDIRNAKRLFGSTPIEDQMYYSQVHYSYALSNFKKATAAGEFGAAARFLKIMQDIKGNDQVGIVEEQMREMADTIKNSQVIFIVDDPTKVGLKHYDPEYIEKLKRELSINKNDKLSDEFSEFEEVE